MSTPMTRGFGKSGRPKTVKAKKNPSGKKLTLLIQKMKRDERLKKKSKSLKARGFGKAKEVAKGAQAQRKVTKKKQKTVNILKKRNQSLSKKLKELTNDRKILAKTANKAMKDKAELRSNCKKKIARIKKNCNKSRNDIKKKANAEIKRLGGKKGFRLN